MGTPNAPPRYAANRSLGIPLGDAELNRWSTYLIRLTAANLLHRQKFLDWHIQNRLRWENDAFRVYSRNTFYTADQHTLYILESNLSREHKPHERVLLQKATPRWTTQVHHGWRRKRPAPARSSQGPGHPARGSRARQVVDPLDSSYSRKPATSTKFSDSYIQNRLCWKKDAFKLYLRTTFYTADQHSFSDQAVILNAAIEGSSLPSRLSTTVN